MVSKHRSIAGSFAWTLFRIAIVHKCRLIIQHYGSACAREMRRNTSTALVKRSQGNVLVTGKRSKGPMNFLVISKGTHRFARREKKPFERVMDDCSSTCYIKIKYEYTQTHTHTHTHTRTYRDTCTWTHALASTRAYIIYWRVCIKIDMLCTCFS